MRFRGRLRASLTVLVVLIGAVSMVPVFRPTPAQGVKSVTPPGADPWLTVAAAPPSAFAAADHAALDAALHERRALVGAAASRGAVARVAATMRRVAPARPPVPAPRPPAVVTTGGPRMVWPAAGSLTGWFGERRGGHAHPGIDVDGETGDAVWAAADGGVLHAGPAPAGYSGYGIVVLIDHGGGVVTLAAHLSRVTVRAGQVVRAGDVVGAVGTTGNVTGSHLHFEVRRGGVPVDPLGWLPARAR